METTLEKVCKILTEKIDNLEFVNQYQARKIEELEAENKQLKEKQQAVNEFVDRTQASIETR